MRFLSVIVLCTVVAACSCLECGEEQNSAHYQVLSAEDGYTPPATRQVFKVADYEIKQGQQMRDFFDDFEEPMHAEYVGNDLILWTYYLNHDGKIVRYCDLNKYAPKSLCEMKVHFYKTYVSDVSSNC